MPSEGWAVSRPSSNIQGATSATLTPTPAATGWNVTRPAAATALDEDDFFGVRSRTFKAASILKDLQESSAGGVSAHGSARPSLEVRMLFA